MPRGDICPLRASPLLLIVRASSRAPLPGAPPQPASAPFAGIPAPLPPPSHGNPALLAYNFQTAAVHTAVFDGPMELLLFLVRREGVDIREVPISPITDAFLHQLDLMAALDLDVAGEFLVMASTLCFLKSREIIPSPRLRPGDEDEAAEIREQLHRRLQEYARYREASEALGRLPWLDRDVFTARPAPVQGVERAIIPGVDALGLLEIFYEVLCRREAAPPVHEVSRDPSSFRDMADRVLALLNDELMELADLLFGFSSPAERVLAFLAVLELARLRLLSIEQDHHLSPVVLGRRSDAASGVLDGLVVWGETG